MKRLNPNNNWFSIWPVMALMALFLADKACAGIPSPALPTGGAASTNWITMLKGYVADGSNLLTLVVSVGVFILLSYFIAADLAAVRRGDKEWGDLGLMAVIGAAAFMWVSYLLGQVAGVFT